MVKASQSGSGVDIFPEGWRKPAFTVTGQIRDDSRERPALSQRGVIGSRARLKIWSDNLGCRFESDRWYVSTAALNDAVTCPGSSVVEQVAVNRRVGGSNPSQDA